MFRLTAELRGYLSVEVFGASAADCIDKFKAAAEALADERGADWSDDIQAIVDRATHQPERCLTDLTFGAVFIDHERVA